MLFGFKKSRRKEGPCSDRAGRWNHFIQDICMRDLSLLSPVQRIAVLCFWYDTEMGSGGYSGYLDNYPDTDPEELAQAIAVVADERIADNCRTAAASGHLDGYVATDMAYYAFSPSLYAYLTAYVEAHWNEIMDNNC